MFISLELEGQDFSEITVVMGNAAKLYHVSTEKKPNIYPHEKERERKKHRQIYDKIYRASQARTQHNIDEH